ncbi:HET-domain-containing [Diaporthe eres]|nr:HET-domain-containing [Diaporthe eres]
MAHSKGILELEGQGYELIPVEHRAQQSIKLRKFDDPQLGKIPEYEYKALEGSHKKIRLLQLKSGAIDSPDIFCELVEADYDNPFHIPTYVDDKSNDDRSDKVDRSVTKQKEVKTPEEEFKILEELQKREMEYEALSWCWGKDVAQYVVLIIERNSKHEEKTYKLRVREQLALALKYLRHRDTVRTLWIDAICIDQDNPGERNHQVQMMSRIYTRAREVCVWLGDGDSSSKIAIDFITNEIMELRNFDTLSHDKQYTDKWKALMMLMQREWFSRRWVVQEIALANKATIHCGLQSMPWKDFAIAVELFVEVETATHRLSEIMQRDAKSQHVPGWFEYVSALGASLLVQATGKVFRAQRSPLDDGRKPEDKSSAAGVQGPRSAEGPKSDNEGSDDREKHLAARKERLRTLRTIDPLDRRSLLSLEYLVSTLFIFGASEPRDAIYAMLALSRDAAPFATSGLETIRDLHDDDTRLIMMTCEPFLEEKPFIVDYQRPYTDVCKDFIDFAIQRRKKLDPSQALDVLCRPWALPPRTGRSIRLPKVSRKRKSDRIMEKRDTENRPWKKVKSNSDIRGHKITDEDLEVDERPMKNYQEECEKVQHELTWEHVENLKRPPGAADTWKVMDLYFPPSKSEAKAAEASESQAEEDIPLPSWVAQASRAPIMLDFTPGIEPRITGRSHADPLVGHPQDGHRNYSAAQTQALRSVKFRKRPLLGHYSLFVEGFVLEEVKEVLDASQGGNIPKSWLDMAKWDDHTEDPPGDFWRTLVADRGRDNRNPPYYYARACRESAVKGGIASGRIDTAALINNEQNSIVAEFCRRVHSVIWNRRLFRTSSGRLGLATSVEDGDKVCVLYGCTVPVVLQEQGKKPGDQERENQEDCVNSLRRVVKRMEQLRERKAQYQTRKRNGEFTKEWTDDVTKRLQEYNKSIRGKSESDTIDNDDSQEDDEATLEGNARQEPTRAGSGETEGSVNQTEDRDSGQTQESHAQTDSGGDRQVDHSGETADFEPGPPIRRPTSFKVKQKEAKITDCAKWYKFRGDCYLHGMMDGEAIRERLYKEIVEQKFELR